MIIWLASYPKSGNTLVRSILTSLIFTNDGKVDFEKLHRINNFPAGPFFEKFTSDFGNIKEISKYWIKAQEVLNKNKKLKFFKTHNSLCSINGNAFTNSNNTVGTIYIVRDPRDIIISASKYYNKSHNETKENMFNRHMDLINKYNDKPISTFLGSWSDHYNSWTKNTKNILLLKYEDLINNKEVEIRKILNFINKFAKLSVDENKIKNCIETSSFKNMKIMENKGLFKENSKDLNGNLITFFNSGKNGNWRGQLEEKIVKEIEDNFQKEMKELGYID
ncbi:sulfotransferase domain-containing protein [Candidatus Pelagibacter sp.]|nr:sulfotransferase domain-containing protein [Candidatus Pelagibacter sp.]